LRLYSKYAICLQILAERYHQKHPLGSAYVSAYEARPTLNFREEKHKRFISLSFMEAVSQDSIISTEELIPAYRVAGDDFQGCLKRHFLVLDDDEAAKQPAKASTIKKKNKRHASGDSTWGGKKKAVPSTQ
jgi:hypothetical protein